MEEEIKILYVDDDPDLLEIARLFLEETEIFRVSTSLSAQDALGSSQIPSYDIIIADYQIPGIDGIAFLKEVRHRYGDIPFILFTGRGREEIVIEAINNSADFYLQKGGDPTTQFTELVHMILRSVLRKRSELSRVKAETALKVSEEKYRHILEYMQDAYFRVDERGIITMANPSAVRTYGYESAEEMIGIPVVSLYAGSEQQEGNIVRKLRETGWITDYSGEAVKKDGTIFWVSVNAQYIKDRDGRILGTEAIVRDITERKAMERAVREANRKLGLLNSITRHDITNQLTILEGFSRIAAVKVCDPVIAGYLAKIDDSAVTIRHQIAFTKAYQDLGVHMPGWFVLKEIIAKVARPEVVFSRTCNDIEVFSDPLLEKVFFNLFENALRHGGHVTEIRIRCEETPGFLLILVEDNGTGIPVDEKEKIFGKGFGKNTGLGLFLAREILAITGITIRETGTPGKGATFEIAVPKGQFRSVQQKN